VRDFCSDVSKVYVVREDLDERAIDHRSLLQEVEFVDRNELPALLSGYDQVWHW